MHVKQNIGLQLVAIFYKQEHVENKQQWNEQPLNSNDVLACVAVCQFWCFLSLLAMIFCFLVVHCNQQWSTVADAVALFSPPSSFVVCQCLLRKTTLTWCGTSSELTHHTCVRGAVEADQLKLIIVMVCWTMFHKDWKNASATLAEVCTWKLVPECHSYCFPQGRDQHASRRCFTRGIIWRRTHFRGRFRKRDCRHVEWWTTVAVCVWFRRQRILRFLRGFWQWVGGFRGWF